MEKTYSVYAFDFDGTLTTKDTFFAFLGYSVGYAKLVCCLILLLPSILLMFLHKITVQEAKEKLFARCFRGMPAEEFDRECRDFAAQNGKLLRRDGIDFIKSVCQEHRVLIVSASIRNYVSEFLKDCNVEVEATVPEVDASGRMSGKFLGANCKGEEKVRRIKKHFPDRQEYKLIVFGDSSGDRRMFDFADETHWKPFRKRV